ncbi:MAG: xanthine dehydrogenase family protein molybdopterin-binding subunit [Pseudomonadota bacterium]
MINGIGKPVRRKEDGRFLQGQGRYTADVNFDDQLHLAVLRAPVAHGKINSIDTRAAAALPGVVTVITCDDLEKAGYGEMPCVTPTFNVDGSKQHLPPHWILAKDKMAYFGEPVVAVVAETRLIAKDAVELIELDYQDLPAVPSISLAAEEGAPLVWDDVPGNQACHWVFGDKAAIDAAFSEAAHVVSLDAVQNRLTPSAMEPRSVVADYDPGKDTYTVYLSNQNPHIERMITCRTTMPFLEEYQLRVIAPDVGGGFGSKSPQYSENYLCLYAAKLTGKPVKWVGERSESFVSDTHARDHVTQASMAVAADGKILAIKSAHLADLGAYSAIFGPLVPTVLYATMLSGVYTVPAVYAECKLMYTNTVPTDAYRGAGRPEAAYTVERLVELAAEAVGIDAIEMRRRNFIPADAFPYPTCTGHTYDSGDYHQCLDKALKAIDYDGFAERQHAAAAEGNFRGIGMCVYTEVAGVGPSQPAVMMGSEIGFYEVTTVRVNPDGSVTVITGAHSHGQGHETSFAQVVADKLNVPLESVTLIHGDTGEVPYGTGTFGSRSISLGGGALVLSLDKVIIKCKKIAAFALESTPDKIDFIDGFFKVKDSDRIMAFQEIANLAYVPGAKFPIEELEPGLEETSFFDPPNNTFPGGCHICEIEIDADTGKPSIVNYVAADDFGVVINPMIVDGQVHGGLAQGIGQALFEHTIFDQDTAQMLTGSFLDYCMPRADDLPSFTVQTIENTTPSNPLGAKGCGEAGAIAAPAAVVNAICNALKPLGVNHIPMPATSEKIWLAINAARSRIG